MRSEAETHYAKFRHPLVGELLLTADGACLTGVYYTDAKNAPMVEGGWKRSPNHPVLVMACSQLNEFLRGKRKKFTVPLSLSGTEFQRKIWQLVAQIPWGTVISYSELAAQAGMPGARRTVGTAVARNPLDIFIPAHRVVAQDGGLGGFAGKWNRKEGLLKLEGHEL